MSNDLDLEWDEDEDSQQLQQVVELDDRDVEDIFLVILDRLRAEDTVLREYIRQTVQDSMPAKTYMGLVTSKSLGDELGPWVSQACDDHQTLCQMGQGYDL